MARNDLAMACGSILATLKSSLTNICRSLFSFCIFTRISTIAPTASPREQYLINCEKYIQYKTPKILNPFYIEQNVKTDTTNIVYKYHNIDIYRVYSTLYTLYVQLSTQRVAIRNKPQSY